MSAIVAFIANGKINGGVAIEREILSCDRIIAVDGGLKFCSKMGITPNQIIGDFDSVSSALLEEYSHVDKKTFPKDKDKTDLELALEMEKFEKGKIYGAVGGRVDHLLGNIILLSRYRGRVFIETEKETLFILHREVEMECFKGQVISLIPLNGKVEGVCSQGLKWELKDAVLDKNFIGISNQCLSKSFFISAAKGDLLCCLNKVK